MLIRSVGRFLCLDVRLAHGSGYCRVILASAITPAYRPGLIFSVRLGAMGAVAIFFVKISFSELDYQLYIAKNNPEVVREFHDRSMSDAIDKAIVDPSTESHLRASSIPPSPSAPQGTQE